MLVKKSILILSVCLFAIIKIFGQAAVPVSQNHTNNKNNAASFGINIPAGEFSKTHTAGIGLGYSWGHHRFGYLPALPKKLIGFTAEGSLDYYFGRKEAVAAYNYRYSGYTCIHAFAGAIYNPSKKGNISLTTGPALGIYKGNADPGFGADFNGRYAITDKIEIGTGIVFLKHKDAAVLWVISIRAGYCF